MRRPAGMRGNPGLRALDEAFDREERRRKLRGVFGCLLLLALLLVLVYACALVARQAWGAP